VLVLLVVLVVVGARVVVDVLVVDVVLEVVVVVGTVPVIVIITPLTKPNVPPVLSCFLNAAANISPELDGTIL